MKSHRRHREYVISGKVLAWNICLLTSSPKILKLQKISFKMAGISVNVAHQPNCANYSGPGGSGNRMLCRGGSLLVSFSSKDVMGSSFDLVVSLRHFGWDKGAGICTNINQGQRLTYRISDIVRTCRDRYSWASCSPDSVKTFRNEIGLDPQWFFRKGSFWQDCVDSRKLDLFDFLVGLLRRLRLRPRRKFSPPPEAVLWRLRLRPRVVLELLQRHPARTVPTASRNFHLRKEPTQRSTGVRATGSGSACYRACWFTGTSSQTTAQQWGGISLHSRQ